MSTNVINITDRLHCDKRPSPVGARAQGKLGPAVASALLAGVKAALRALVWAIKTLTYLVLVIFAGPARVLLGLTMLAAVFGAPMVFLGYRHDPAHQHQFLAILAVMGLGSAAILVVYEQLLLRLAPQPPAQVIRITE